MYLKVNFFFPACIYFNTRHFNQIDCDKTLTRTHMRCIENYSTLDICISVDEIFTLACSLLLLTACYSHLLALDFNFSTYYYSSTDIPYQFDFHQLCVACVFSVYSCLWQFFNYLCNELYQNRYNLHFHLVFIECAPYCSTKWQQDKFCSLSLINSFVILKCLTKIYIHTFLCSFFL